jgi:NAD(P)-dependent dehydrogenase (short-subunit alcohol dehydrogenase family)
MSELQGFDDFFNLDGKVVLVTGGKSLNETTDHYLICLGSRGLGLHTATAFLKAGAKTVFITARKTEGEQGINQAIDKLNSIPGIKGKAIGIAANVAQEKEVLKLRDEVMKVESKLHVLVANAGATWGGPFETTPDQANQKVLDLNVRGVFNVIRS